MTTVRHSQYNNTGVSLNVGATFTGQYERTLLGLEISTFISSSSFCLVTIDQSVDASNIRVTTSFNYNPANDVSTFSIPAALPFFRVRLENLDIAAQAYLSLNTYVIDTPPQQVQITGVLPPVTIAGIVDISGNVIIDAPLPAGTNVIGQVGFDGNYNIVRIDDSTLPLPIAIDAANNTVQLLAGSSLPTGTNTIGNVVISDSVSTINVTTITNALPAGTNILGVVGLDSTGGANTVQISQSGTNNGVVVYGSLPAGTDTIGKVILDTGTNSIGTVGINTTLNTVKIDPLYNTISGTVSLTDPTSVRIRDAYGDPIVTTAGNLMVGINNIYTANPLHTILDSGSVSVVGSVATTTPESFSTRVTTAANTAVLVTTGGHLLNFIATNKSATIDAYVKLYDSVASPNPASAVPFMIARMSRDATGFTPVLQVNSANLKITHNLYVRAVIGSADTDVVDTGVSLDISFFGTPT